MGQGLSLACLCGYYILVARLLGSTEFGIYVGAVAMVSILSQYTTLGSPLVLLRYVSPEPKNFTLYWGNVLVTTTVMGSLLVALLTWGGPRWAHSYSWHLVLCVAFGDCVCAQLTAAAGRVFQAFERLRITAALNLLVNSLRVLLAALLLWRLHHATAQQWVIAALFISFLAATTALVLVTRCLGRPAFSGHLFRARIGEGFVFALSNSASCVYDDVDKAMLGHYGMNAANGIYSMAYRAINVCMISISSIHQAASPRFFRKGVEGIHSTGAYALRLLKRTAPLGMILGIFMFLIAPVIPHVVGKGFSESVSALRWLCLLPLFRSFQWSAGDAMTASGHQKLRLGTQSTAAVFNFGTNLYLIPHYGWLGAAWASLATDGLLAVFNWTVLLWLTSKSESQICVTE